MDWDGSDSDIEPKFTELKDKEVELETQLQQIRRYQTCIISLKLIPISHLSNNIPMISYAHPVDFAGNPIDNTLRATQKTALIVNIDEFLGGQ